MLGGYAEQVLGSPRFFDAKWLNSSKTAKANVGVFEQLKKLGA